MKRPRPPRPCVDITTRLTSSSAVASRLDFRHYGHAVKLDGEAVFRSTAYQEGRERAEFLWRRVGYGAHESRRAPISGPGSAQSEMAEVEARGAPGDPGLARDRKS